jgi:hypothetical protein
VTDRGGGSIALVELGSTEASRHARQAPSPSALSICGRGGGAPRSPVTGTQELPDLLSDFGELRGVALVDSFLASPLPRVCDWTA